MTQRIATGAVMLALALAPAQRVMADGGDFALGIAAGVIGSAVVRDIKKKNQAKAQPTYSQPATASSSGSAASSAQREQNRQVQSALNYFAFPVGAPDGVLGRNSRAGIAEFQGYMGYPATGQLTLAQRDFLLTSFNRAQAGGAATDQAIAANPQGVRGLLTDFAGQLAPVAATAAATGAVQGKVPSFMAAGTGGGSLSAFCSGSVPAGATATAAQADAQQVLAQEFCVARDQAIGESERLAAQVPGFTPEQIAAQCSDFGPLLSDYVTALGEQPEAQVLERVSGWTRASGVAPDSLGGTAQVCLGLGYRDDDLQTAIGSALVLTALGQSAYAELPAHHLVQGVGVPRRPDLALDWYDAAVTAQPQVFDVSAPGRLDAMRQAAGTLAGRADGGSLPTFATGAGGVATQASASP